MIRPPVADAADKKIVLIDDDRFFGFSLLSFARSQGIDLDYYESLGDLGYVGNLGRYRAAVVDFHLERMTGVEIAEYLEALFGNIPMVLISSDAAAGSGRLPGCVHKFVNKSDGLQQIVEAVRAVAH
jgi:FixJ family two-component response regulator